MTPIRPSTPSAIKRRLRQEAGFGCCLCGHPFIQYHHIVPWSEDEHFRPEDMMVLCGQCHPLCTVGALSETDQRRAKLRPKNLIDNQLKGTLWVATRDLTVRIAGGLAINTPDLLTLGGRTVLNAKVDQEDGRVLVSARIADQQGQPIATITDNEWSMLPDRVWDFEAYPRHATIRQGPADIAFKVDTRGPEVSFQGKWFHNGKVVEFTPTHGMVGATRLPKMNAKNCGGLLEVD